MSKIIYATIKLTVKNKTTEEDITEADYEFKHPNIIATEWIETEEYETWDSLAEQGHSPKMIESILADKESNNE